MKRFQFHIGNSCISVVVTKINGSNLLSRVAKIRVSGTSRFIAMNNFCEGQIIGGMEIVRVGEIFKSNFLCKVENNIKPAVIDVRKLRESVSNSSIITILNGAHETTLFHFHELLGKQGFGEVDILSKGFFVAYAIGKEDKLHTLYACSNRRGLEIGAIPISNKDRQHKDAYIISSRPTFLSQFWSS